MKSGQLRGDTYDRAARALGQWGTRLLRLLPAETAHEFGLWLLEHRMIDHLPMPNVANLLSGMGIDIPGLGNISHPIGLAAGFDKNARAPFGFVRMGAAFMEIGTVTPEPQAGNVRPRIFRDSRSQSLINRMGFPSDGMKVVAERLSALNWAHDKVPLGVNLGKNKATPEGQAVDDYIVGLKGFEGLAHFFVLNVSSPNTPQLRQLANKDFLSHIALREPQLLPRLWVKLSPDLGKAELQALVAVISELGYRGLVLTNTHLVEWPELGGQSGPPLSVMASTALEWAYDVHKGSLPMIASGGVMTGGDVFQKIARGAAAVEIYTAMVYRGPWAIIELLEELKAELSLRGFSSVREAVGSHYDS